MFGDSCGIPIVEVSQYVSAEDNIKLGRALASLRDEGVLILSGGLTIHTFDDFSAFAPGSAKQGYKDYEHKLKNVLAIQDPTKRTAQLVDIMNDPWFKRAHPTIEHFTPIYIAAGAGSHGTTEILSELHGAISVAFN